jgi:DNA polymerase III subunit gamma/tau
MLSTGAFNALLKILEEPPDHVKFIFATTEPNKILPTIQSRCQRFDFQNISTLVIGQQLEKILLDEKIAYEKDLIIHLSRLANGSMRDALSLLDQLISGSPPPLTLEQLHAMLGTPDREKVVGLLSAMGAQDGAAALNAIDQLLTGGQNAVQICDLVVENLRDLMVFVTAGPDSPTLALTADEKKQLAQMAKGFDIAALVYNITALEKLRWALKNSESNRALLEAAILRLTLSEHFIGLDQIGSGAASVPMPAVKKKLAGDPAPHARADEPAVSQAVSVAIDLASIQNAWESICAQCGKLDAMVESFLKQGVPAALSGSSLEIRFKRDGQGQLAKGMCERKTEKIEQGLSQILGTQLKVRLEFGQVDAKIAPPADTAKPEPLQPARANRKQQNEALNDPAVQMVLKGLDATPIEIQRIGEEEEETPEREGLFEDEM